MTGGCSGLLIQFPVMMGVFAVNYRLLSYVLKIPKETIEILKAQGEEAYVLGSVVDGEEGVILC